MPKLPAISTKIQKVMYLALAAVGFCLAVGLSGAEQFPYEIFQFAGWILFLGGLQMWRRVKDPVLYGLESRAARQIRGNEFFLTIITVYFGLFIGTFWSAESVDFLVRYMPIIVVPALVYYVIVSSRTATRVRQEYYREDRRLALADQNDITETKHA